MKIWEFLKKTWDNPSFIVKNVQFKTIKPTSHNYFIAFLMLLIEAGKIFLKKQFVTHNYM